MLAMELKTRELFVWQQAHVCQHIEQHRKVSKTENLQGAFFGIIYIKNWGNNSEKGFTSSFDAPCILTNTGAAPKKQTQDSNLNEWVSYH